MKALVLESLFEYSCILEACNSTVLKRLQHMFSCGFCQIFKNIYFAEYLPKAGSEADLFKVPAVPVAFLTESLVVSFTLICRFLCQQL